MTERRRSQSRIDPAYTLPEWHQLPWLYRAGVLLNLWLHGAPSTQFNVLIGALLSFGTYWLYVYLTVRNKAIDAIAFGLWLGFVAAWAGFSYKQFKAKRETDHDALAIKHGQPMVSVGDDATVNTTGDVKIDSQRGQDDRNR